MALSKDIGPSIVEATPKKSIELIRDDLAQADTLFSGVSLLVAVLKRHEARIDGEFCGKYDGSTDWYRLGPITSTALCEVTGCDLLPAAVLGRAYEDLAYITEWFVEPHKVPADIGGSQYMVHKPNSRTPKYLFRMPKGLYGDRLPIKQARFRDVLPSRLNDVVLAARALRNSGEEAEESHALRELDRICVIGQAAQSFAADILNS
ncbi:hypothetical protein KC878_01210 [Candidatus Saccharibacteria bacterium]|nr:hypothetical protein [Candidatus Saccharibacteria bacterium]MCB9821592.1 hypothetical protein [Candidatus Nomurabacteria bacterium]